MGVAKLRAAFDRFEHVESELPNEQNAADDGHASEAEAEKCEINFGQVNERNKERSFVSQQFWLEINYCNFAPDIEDVDFTLKRTSKQPTKLISN